MSLYLGTSWPALPALAMLLAGLWGLRRAPRPTPWTWGVLALALAVRAALMPLERLEFDGHEAEYRDLLLGRREPGRGGTMLLPAMQLLYQALGLVLPDERAMTALALGASLLSIAALMGVTGRLLHPRAAPVAGALLALSGNHAFWSSSGYNVILPHALGALAFWALAVLLRGGPPLACGLAAGGAAALAVATRVELVLLAPLGLAWLALERPARPLAWAPGLVAGAALGAVALALVLQGGPTPGAEQRALAWSINLGLLTYLAPFDAPWQWPGVALGAALAARRAPRTMIPLLGLALGGHVLFASFEDYGYRHALVSIWALCGLASALALRRWGLPLLALAAAGLGAQSLDVARRFYAPEEAFAEALDAAHPELPVVGLDGLPDCALICEDARAVPEGLQRSHFNLLDPVEAEALRARGGCLAWLVGVQDHRWSSRAVRDRALRTLALYAHEPRAVVKDPDRGYVALLVMLGPRRNPSPLDGFMPVEPLDE